ncbi:hypothetical protein BJX99DRAFT_255317 [Aspergillus californicus]
MSHPENTESFMTAAIMMHEVGYHWIIVIGPFGFYEIPMWARIHVYSKLSGYSMSAEIESPIEWTSFLKEIGATWDICDLPGTTVDELEQIKNMIIHALERATAQEEYTWLSVFLKQLREWGWINKERKKMIEGVIWPSPYEYKYKYAR